MRHQPAPNRKLIALFAFAVLACALFGCTSGGGGESAPATSETLPVVEVSAHWASGLARDVATLTGSADIVFVGVVTERIGQREEALRDGAEPGGRGSFPITQFAITVERVLTGDAEPGDSVVLEQAGGERDRTAGRVTLRLENDPAVAVGGRYLFFATWKENGTLTAPPYGRLPVEGDRVAEPAAWRNLGAVQRLTGLSVSEASEEVQGLAH